MTVNNRSDTPTLVSFNQILKNENKRSKVEEKKVAALMKTQSEKTYNFVKKAGQRFNRNNIPQEDRHEENFLLSFQYKKIVIETPLDGKSSPTSIIDRISPIPFQPRAEEPVSPKKRSEMWIELKEIK